MFIVRTSETGLAQGAKLRFRIQFTLEFLVPAAQIVARPSLSLRPAKALRYLPRLVQWSFKHGDFTPWNILDERGNLFVLDWEYAEESALPGWDLFHFIVQTSMFVKGSDGRRGIQAVRRQSTAPGGLGEFLSPAGATQQLLGPLFFLYVADVMSWYLLRDAEASDEKGQRQRDAWTYLLTMAASAESPF